MTALKDRLPWTSTPLIVNAPMGGFAGPDLAVAVTKAGGLGQIGAVESMQQLDGQLLQAANSLKADSRFRNFDTLPIGVGLLLFILKLEDAIAVLRKYNPAIVWLFAAKEMRDYAQWTPAIRQACPKSQIWIQVGSVSGALQLARSCQPDALILQGADAGGHGFEKSAGIVSLLPEAADTLAREGFGEIPLLASGGITNGRAAASAFALGAVGVVMGTRFLAAKETTVHPLFQAAVLAAVDGGQTTVRAKLFDELRGPNMWPGNYDGRSIRTQSYLDYINGVSLPEVRELHQQALDAEGSDMGWGASKRATVWAGTGVGMVKKVEAAGDIVQEIRKEAVKALEEAVGRAKL